MPKTSAVLPLTPKASETKAMTSETPLLQPIVPAYHLHILSDEQLAHFKSATLEILEEVGGHCPSEEEAVTGIRSK